MWASVCVKQVDRGSEKGLPKISMHNVLSSCVKHPYNYVYMNYFCYWCLKRFCIMCVVDWRGGICVCGGGGIKMLYYNTPS